MALYACKMRSLEQNSQGPTTMKFIMALQGYYLNGAEDWLINIGNSRKVARLCVALVWNDDREKNSSMSFSQT